jgi:lysine 2,3-aminomutase
MPQFVMDLPGGHGKVPLVPNSIRAILEDRIEIMSYTGIRCEYPLLDGEHEELRRLQFG